MAFSVKSLLLYWDFSHYYIEVDFAWNDMQEYTQKKGKEERITRNRIFLFANIPFVFSLLIVLQTQAFE